MRTPCAVLLFAIAVFAGDPLPYPEHVGEAIGPHNHAHWPVRVRNLDQIRWTFREGKHAGMAAPIGAGLLFVQAGGGGIRGVEAGTGKRWWLSEGHTKYWNYSTCVMGPGGIAYGGNFDWIQAVTRRGKRLWRTELQCGWIHSPPVVSPDGKAVYVGADGLGIASLNAANGRINWLRRDFASPGSKYVFADSNTLIVSTRDRLVCFEPNGAERWSQPEPLNNPMVVDHLLIGTRKSKLIAQDLRKPHTAWTFPTGGTVAGIALTDRRRIVAAMTSGELVCVTLDGRERWRKRLSQTALYRPVTALGGETLVADAQGVVYLCGPRGEVISSIETGGQPYRWRPTVSRDGMVFLNHREQVLGITGATRPPPPPVVASELAIVADDFVVEVWVNGERVPLTARQLVAEVHGATTEKVHVDLQEGDWVVFHVVANRLRWGGASYFGVHATAPNGEPAFVSTTEGGWFACDDPSKAAAFIARRGAGTETLARAPERPWHDAKARWHELLGREFPGQPVWGASPSTWIKYVVRAHD